MTGSPFAPFAAAPPPDPAVVALVAAAVEKVWPRPEVAAGPPGSVATVWRFSGRWWARAADPRQGGR